jgi:peptidoglycan/xylan/chitin deacetylase (PgdA/CDA1 family)
MIGLSRMRLDREVARWHTAGYRPRLWWRDDDARLPGDRLERLLHTADGLPLSLAIIPNGATPALARRLAREEAVTVSQHGVDHHNYRNPAEPVGDYPLHTPISQVAKTILQGEQQLRDCGLDPRFFTPPGNHIDETLLEALRVAGYRTLSAWNEEQLDRCSGLRRLDVHIDLLRWKGGPRFRGKAETLDAVREQLAERRLANDFARPIGLLTHHLDHDEAAWRFLGWFVDFVKPRFEIGGYFDFLRA